MINFTLKGKNFHPSAKYWWPDLLYYENAEAKWTKTLSDMVLISQTVHFSNVPTNVQFGVGFYRTHDINDMVTGPYLFASTDLFVLKDGGSYILDFHGEVGIPTLLEEEAPWKAPAELAPWPPNWGPPLPRVAPPWPPYISIWQEGWRGEIIWNGEVVPAIPGLK